MTEIDQRIKELKKKSKVLEGELQVNLRHLKNNYPAMTVNTFFGNNNKSPKKIVDEVASTFITSVHMQRVYSRIAMNLADRAIDGVSGKLGDWFFKKKKKW